MYTDNETNMTSVHVLIACSWNRPSQLVYYKITPDTPALSTGGSNEQTDTQNSFKDQYNEYARFKRLFMEQALPASD